MLVQAAAQTWNFTSWIQNDWGIKLIILPTCGTVGYRFVGKVYWKLHSITKPNHTIFVYLTILSIDKLAAAIFFFFQCFACIFGLFVHLHRFGIVVFHLIEAQRYCCCCYCGEVAISYYFFLFSVFFLLLGVHFNACCSSMQKFLHTYISQTRHTESN